MTSFTPHASLVWDRRGTVSTRPASDGLGEIVGEAPVQRAAAGEDPVPEPGEDQLSQALGLRVGVEQLAEHRAAPGEELVLEGAREARVELRLGHQARQQRTVP